MHVAVLFEKGLIKPLLVSVISSNLCFFNLGVFVIFTISGGERTFTFAHSGKSSTFTFWILSSYSGAICQCPNVMV